MTPAVSVSGVSKAYRLYSRRQVTLKETFLRGRRGSYEEFLALDDVSFAIEPGEAVGIIGRNGAGKSTLLKLLARIVVPDRGSVTVDGRMAALLEVGAGFHPDYTAVENIMLSGAIYGIPRPELEARVDDIIAFAELERFADNPVRTYSSGMYARLGFSIAVNVDPDVLVVDEVLAVGDQSFQARCLERMLEFRDAGKTLILVTHDLQAVESFCDRAIWIDAGKVAVDDLPHHAIRAYVTAVNETDAEWASRVHPTGAQSGAHVPAVAAHPIHLTSMEFLDGAGHEREVFENGAPMTVRVHFTCASPQPEPFCELEFTRHDQTVVARPSSRLAGFHVDELPAGAGYFEWTIDDLPFTPGTYYVTPRIRERTGMSSYDEHDRWYRIRVHTGAYLDRDGVVALPGRWRTGGPAA